MSHFALLWKARAIERYRRNYEREKIHSIEGGTDVPPRNFLQKLRHYRYRFRRKFKKIFVNLFPKRVLNCLVYVKTDQTFPNFILKSIVGFLGGIVLTYVFFMFFVFQLSISLVHATVMCSLIGVLLTLGLAFSYRVRCLVFLLFPQFFSEIGRYTLIGYALILILTGPAKNTLHNSQVLSESMACGQEQLKANVQQIKESIARPFNSMKDTIQLMVESVKVVAAEMKETLMSINRMVLSIVNVIQSALNWLGSIVSVCSKKMGTPSERCHRALEDGVLDCQAKLGAYFSWLCNVAYVAKAACETAKLLDAMCVLVDFVGNTVVATIKRKLRTFSNHVKTMLYVSVHVHHAYSFNTNSSRSASQVAAGIVTEIRHRADRFLQWFSWMSCITSLFLLIIIFRAKYYQYMYLGRMRFDNRYLTKPFRELDLRRARESRDTVLPLNRRERTDIVKTTSWRLVGSEKRHLARSAVFLAVTTIKLLVHIAADYSLYWLLMTVRYHGRFEAPPKPPDAGAGIIVTGGGSLASMLRALTSALTAPLRAPPPMASVSCLPDPSSPDAQRNMQIGFLIGLLWTLLLLQPYGLRLRHVIMDHYRPERARARAVWLYNHILRRRGGFLKLARRKLHREYKMHAEERFTFRQWLDSAIPCRWLRALLRTGGGEDRCVLCGVSEDPTNPDSQLIRCETPGCQAVYCVSCYQDIGRLCTACLTPSDYGDLSDISLEKGSSAESDSDTNTECDRPVDEDDTHTKSDSTNKDDEYVKEMEDNRGKLNQKSDSKSRKIKWRLKCCKNRRKNNPSTENENKIFKGNIQVVPTIHTNSSTEYNSDDPLLDYKFDDKKVYCFWKNRQTHCYGGGCTSNSSSSSFNGNLNVKCLDDSLSESETKHNVMPSCSKWEVAKKKHRASETYEEEHSCLNEVVKLKWNRKVLPISKSSRRRKEEMEEEYDDECYTGDDVYKTTHLPTCKIRSANDEEITAKRKQHKDKSLNTVINMKNIPKMPYEPACSKINRRQAMQTEDKILERFKHTDQISDYEDNLITKKRSILDCRRRKDKTQIEGFKDYQEDIANIDAEEYSTSKRKIINKMKSIKCKIEKKENKHQVKCKDKVLQHKRRAYYETQQQRAHRSCECSEDNSVCGKCEKKYGISKINDSDDSIHQLKLERCQQIEEHRKVITGECVCRNLSICKKFKNFLHKGQETCITDCELTNLECPDVERFQDSRSSVRQVQKARSYTKANIYRKRVIRLRRKHKSKRIKHVKVVCPKCTARNSNKKCCKKCNCRFKKRKCNKEKYYVKFPLKRKYSCKDELRISRDIKKTKENRRYSAHSSCNLIKTRKECKSSGYKANYENILSCLTKCYNKKSIWQRIIRKLRTKRKPRRNKRYYKTTHIYQNTIVNPYYSESKYSDDDFKIKKQKVHIPETIKIGREFKVIRPKAKWKIPHKVPIRHKRHKKIDTENKDFFTEIYAREMGFEMVDPEDMYDDLIAATDKLKKIALNDERARAKKKEMEFILPKQPVAPWSVEYEWPKQLESPKCLCPDGVCHCRAKKDGLASDYSYILYDDLPKLPIQHTQMVRPKWSVGNLKGCIKRFLIRKKKVEPDLLAGEGTVIPMIDRAVYVEKARHKDVDSLSLDCLARCHKYYEDFEGDDDKEDIVDTLKKQEKEEAEVRRERMALLRQKLTSKLCACGKGGRKLLDEASIQDLLDELCGPDKGYGSTQTSVAADDGSSHVKINMEPWCPKKRRLKKCALKLCRDEASADASRPAIEWKMKTLDGARLNLEPLGSRTPGDYGCTPEEDPKDIEKPKCAYFDPPSCGDGLFRRVQNYTSKILGTARTPWHQESVKGDQKGDDRVEGQTNNKRLQLFDNDKTPKEVIHQDNLANSESEESKDYDNSAWNSNAQVWMERTSVSPTRKDLNKSVDKSTYCRPKSKHDKHRKGYSSICRDRRINKDQSPILQTKRFQNDQFQRDQKQSYEIYESPRPPINSYCKNESPKTNNKNDLERNYSSRKKGHTEVKYKREKREDCHCEWCRNHNNERNNDTARYNKITNSPRTEKGDYSRDHKRNYGNDRYFDTEQYRYKGTRHANNERISRNEYRHINNERRGHRNDPRSDVDVDDFLKKYGCIKEFDIKRRELQEKERQSRKIKWEESLETKFREQEKYKKLYEEAKRREYLREKDYHTQDKDFTRRRDQGDQRDYINERTSYGLKNVYGPIAHYEEGHCRDCEDARRSTTLDNIMKLRENERAYCLYHARMKQKSPRDLSPRPFTKYERRGAKDETTIFNIGKRELKNEATGALDRDKTQHVDVQVETTLSILADTDSLRFKIDEKKYGKHTTASHVADEISSARSEFQNFEPTKTSSPEEKRRPESSEITSNQASPIPPNFNCGFFEMFHESAPSKETVENTLEQDQELDHVSTEVVVREVSTTESQQKEEPLSDDGDASRPPSPRKRRGNKTSSSTIYSYIKGKFRKPGRPREPWLVYK